MSEVLGSGPTPEEGCHFFSFKLRYQCHMNAASRPQQCQLHGQLHFIPGVALRVRRAVITPTGLGHVLPFPSPPDKHSDPASLATHNLALYTATAPCHLFHLSCALIPHRFISPRPSACLGGLSFTPLTPPPSVPFPLPKVRELVVALSCSSLLPALAHMCVRLKLLLSRPAALEAASYSWMLGFVSRNFTGRLEEWE